MKERDILSDILWMLSLLVVLCACPLMSGYAGGPHEESCELMMRGWELVCFSLAGAVPLVLVPIFFFGGGVLGRMYVRAVLFIVGLACGVYSFRLTEQWLIGASDIPISYEYGIVLYPLALLTAALWSVRGTIVKR